jgi:hypothetical protein
MRHVYHVLDFNVRSFFNLKMLQKACLGHLQVMPRAIIHAFTANGHIDKK